MLTAAAILRSKKLLGDHPHLAASRGTIAFWNFLPPDELDGLLRLFQRVNSKTLVISRTLGIEGRKLLTPDDEFDPVKELNEQCDGTLSDMEQLRLEYQELLREHPELAEQMARMPTKAFSGRRARSRITVPCSSAGAFAEPQSY